jgi:hypothetical protein
MRRNKRLKMASMRWAPLILVGCADPPAPSVLRLALGSHWTIDPDSLCGSQDCGFDDVDQLDDVLIEDSGVVGVAEMGSSTFTLEALSTGSSMVTVIGLDHAGVRIERLAQTFVSSVSLFDFEVQCSVYEPSKAPWIFPPSSEIYVEWGMWDSAENALSGEPNFDLGGAVNSELDEESQDGLWVLPEEVGSIEVTSPLFDSSIATLKVHEEGGFDAFETEWWPDEELEIGDVKQLRTAMLVEGQRACLDSEERQAEVLTPETCSFSRDEPVLEIEDDTPTIWVMGHAEGVCTIRIAVPAHGFSETLSIDVINPSVDPEGE